MGDFTGREALQLIRNLGLQLPFLYRSGTVKPGSHAEALREGAQGFFSKDDLQGLLAAIQSALQQEGTPANKSSASDRPLINSSKRAPQAKPAILMVDDHPENLVALRAILEGLDADLVSLSSGLEALRYLLSTEPALILLDVQMPEMDGVETAQILKKRTRNQNIPIIFLTAGERPESVSRCYAAGGIDYLPKPFVPEVLRAKVQILLELHRKNQLLNIQATELQVLNESLEAFSYSVSHDLRAPLRSAAGFSQILLEEYRGKILDQTGEDYLERIQKAVTNMDVMIRDLLAYAHLKREEVVLSTLDLAEVVGKVLEEIADEVEQRKASVIVDVVSGLVTGHRLTLIRALTNLIGNAIKFTKPGMSPELVIRSQERGPTIRLWVEDCGIGIRAMDQGGLFKAFSRLESAKPYAGTGLGLAIVKKAIERMDGQVGLESEYGKGSRFWIELPKS